MRIYLLLTFILLFTFTNQQACTDNIRYVNISVNNVLNLAEVQFFSGGKNIAVGKTAIQSSTLRIATADKAIDNNTNANFDRNSVTHTLNSPSWWLLDLLAEYPFEKIVVFNRLDCCLNRLSGARIDFMNGCKNLMFATILPNMENVATWSVDKGGKVVTVPSTTSVPTTPAPTTRPPSTSAPTTRVPSTSAPTTRAPTTRAPTTRAPTTRAPTTRTPTTRAPSTSAPTTRAPTTRAPTTRAPSTPAPTTRAPTGPEKKILFIGNSYSFGFVNMFNQMSAAGGFKVTSTSFLHPGTDFTGHSKHANINSVTQRSYDYVVMQDQSLTPGLTGPFENSVQALKSYFIPKFNEYGNKKVILYVTWGRRNGIAQYPGYETFLSMNQKLYLGYKGYATVLGEKFAGFANVGEAFRLLYENDVKAGMNPSTNSTSLFFKLYTGDQSHPSLFGNYLITCVMYNTIHKASPVGIQYIPNGISLSEALILQKVAKMI